MKKTITLILAVVLCMAVVLTATACSSTPATASATASASAAASSAATTAASGTPATAQQLTDLKTKYDALVALYADIKATAATDTSLTAEWKATFEKLGTVITQIGDQVKEAKTTEEVTLLVTAIDTMNTQLSTK
jgi:hypothetical protein